MPKKIIPFHDNCTVFISSVLETLRSKNINYLSVYIEKPTESLYYSSCPDQSCLPMLLEIRNSLLSSQKEFQYIMWDAFPFEKKFDNSFRNTRNILSIVLNDGRYQTIFSIGNNIKPASIIPDFISNLEDLKDIALWTKEVALRKESMIFSEDKIEMKKTG